MWSLIIMLSEGVASSSSIKERIENLRSIVLPLRRLCEIGIQRFSPSESNPPGWSRMPDQFAGWEVGVISQTLVQLFLLTQQFSFGSLGLHCNQSRSERRGFTSSRRAVTKNPFSWTRRPCVWAWAGLPLMWSGGNSEPWIFEICRWATETVDEALNFAEVWAFVAVMNISSVTHNSRVRISKLCCYNLRFCLWFISWTKSFF